MSKQRWPILVGWFLFAAISMLSFAASGATIEIVRNGGFESGPPAAPWQSFTSRGPLVTPSGESNSGNGFVARLGGSNSEDDRLIQDLALPFGAQSATLSFRYKLKATGNGKAPDRFSVVAETVAGNIELWSVLATSSVTSWVTAGNLSMNALAGQAFRLSFSGLTDKDQPSTFWIDDVSVRYEPGQGQERTVAFLNPRTGCLGGIGGAGGGQEISISGSVAAAI